MCGLPVSPHLKKPFVLTVYQAPLGKSHLLLSGRHKEDRESLWEPVHNTMLLASWVCECGKLKLKLYRSSVLQGSSTQAGSGAAKELLKGCRFWFI
jgi:hypothetical protein